ncbi:hypothetical protein PGT21_000708 [Puccinia graminis f. sp. tritici]|uniref:Uncharacterized protein n=2 Tax=Puccinia graminis f. sp. tritici TaxID=56615 RepID=A0A5B0LRV5_PUCGR|nr:hypothetical protein PGT21_000708 [Puccinia graminis f. sp. tritici]
MLIRPISLDCHQSGGPRTWTIREGKYDYTQLTKTITIIHSVWILLIQSLTWHEIDSALDFASSQPDQDSSALYFAFSQQDHDSSAHLTLVDSFDLIAISQLYPESNLFRLFTSLRHDLRHRFGKAASKLERITSQLISVALIIASVSLIRPCAIHLGLTCDLVLDRIERKATHLCGLLVLWPAEEEETNLQAEKTRIEVSRLEKIY